MAYCVGVSVLDTDRQDVGGQRIGRIGPPPHPAVNNQTRRDGQSDDASRSNHSPRAHLALNPYHLTMPQIDVFVTSIKSTPALRTRHDRIERALLSLRVPFNNHDVSMAIPSSAPFSKEMLTCTWL